MSALPFEAVLFDCDGVLVDSEPITLRVMTDSLNELGLNMTFEKTVARFIGKTLDKEIPTIEREIGRPVPSDWLLRFRQARNIALENEIQLVPGIIDTLNQLDAKGIPYAVASGADSAKMQITLGKTGLLARFSHALVGSDMVAATKPAPDVYLLAAKMLKVDPKRCLVVDDTQTGVRAGVASGATVFGFSSFTDPQALLDAGADAVFKRMEKLPQLIGLG
jgi:HAD superfamily hydrolase (TIGR01509 family)